MLTSCLDVFSQIIKNKRKGMSMALSEIAHWLPGSVWRFERNHHMVRENMRFKPLTAEFLFFFDLIPF
jgi:hypothetical protein